MQAWTKSTRQGSSEPLGRHFVWCGEPDVSPRVRVYWMCHTILYIPHANPLSACVTTKISNSQQHLVFV